MQYGIGSEIRTSDDDAVWQVLQLMDGTRPVERLVADLRDARPDVSERSIHEIVGSLIDAGFVEEALCEPPAELSVAELDRYSRARDFFSWIDTVPRSTPWEVQRRLKSKHVTILGLGGAGSSVALALASAGVGGLRCVDFDVVESSNLNRQLLYQQEDVGSGKVEAALRRLRGLNSFVDLSGLEVKVEAESDMAPILADTDLLVLCADQPEPRTLLSWTNSAALGAEVPWIMCFYAGPMVVVGLQIPGGTPCYECLRHWAEIEGRIEGGDGSLIPDLRLNAVIGPTAALAGSFAALEAIYYLGDLQPQTVGRIFHLSLTTYDMSYWIDGERWNDCPACGNVPIETA
jgi:molybdopterin-synthase adenylyltransferase